MGDVEGDFVGLCVGAFAGFPKEIEEAKPGETIIYLYNEKVSRA